MRAIAPLSLSALKTTGLLFLIVFSAHSSYAVQPQFSSMKPSGVQRGTTADFTFSGNRLGDVQEILFYTPGFTVQELKAVDDKSVTAKIVVSADCKLGIHAIRLRSASGISTLRTFTVGPYPEVLEKEPNNEFTTPQPVSMNSTVSGGIANEDVDYYEIEAKQGQRISGGSSNFR